MVARRGPAEIFAGRYEIEHEVGKGNQGVVHRALDRVTGEPVALKRWSGFAAPSVRAAFQVDTRTIAALAGPGIVAYRSMGATDGGLFLAMEWVPGGRLSEKLARDRLTAREALDLGKRIAWGLARLHRAGLAHRNVKPANVLLPEGALWCAKLSDAWVDTEEILRGGFDPRLFAEMVGYLSPQAMRHGWKSAGPRDDVYSLGAILFRCITGCMPFPEHDHPDLASAQPKSRVPRDLAQMTPSLPRELHDLVNRMLAHEPDRRPADAVEPCLVLHEVARMLGSYDKIHESDLAPGMAPIPLHFEVREEPRREPAAPAEAEIEVDPAALRGPFVILSHPLDGEPVTVPPRDPRFGEGDVVAGRFAIEEVAGTGSTGVVYKAKDRETRDTVALRILDGAASRREIRRFLGECAKHAQRYHPRIVRVLQRGTIAGRMFLAMDWISGETLGARLSRQPLSMREAAAVIRGLLEALELVHTMGLVQGNLRPDNVFLRNREVEWAKLSDVAVWRESPLLPEVPVQDLAYVAPEVLRTGRWTPTGDVYALGVIAYRLLTGTLPFEASDAEELATRRWAPAQPLAELRPDAPPSLARLVDSLLEKDPSKRPYSAVVAAGWLGSPVDLGWGEDMLPHQVARPGQGSRTAILPPAGPFDPFQHARFQGFLAGELGRRTQVPEARARLSDIAHAKAGAERASPGCGMCGRGPNPVLNRTLVEVRDGGYFPLEDDAVQRARQPAVCSRCFVDPHEDVSSAVERTLESYRGDDTRPVGVLGPTRREVREAIEALYARAVPRMGQGRCLACKAVGQVLKGQHAELCPRCLSAGRAACQAWLDAAPIRKDARVRRELDEIYRIAVERVRGRPIRDPSEGVYRLPPSRVFASGHVLSTELSRLRSEKAPTQRQIDAVADLFADTLLGDVAQAMGQRTALFQPSAGVGDWRVPSLLFEFTGRFRPSARADERLRVAMEVLKQAEHRGASLYPQEGYGSIKA